MKTRLFVLAIAAVTGSACVFFAVPGPAVPLPVRHGDFSTRFQPSAPGQPTERERLAGVGSIKDLRPVETKPR